jgi:hypothetical protein
MKSKSKVITVSLILSMTLLTILSFQNCAGPQIVFSESQLGTPGVCGGISCDLTPLTLTPAVTTILLALGDEDEDELVISGISSQLIAETVVRSSSPVINPRILFVRDANSGNESRSDTDYVKDVLLARYDVTYFDESQRPLRSSDVQGYDLIWFNNPGTPFGLRQSYNILLNFSGGVVLQGDDLSRGEGFSLQALTGLTHVSNGTRVSCSNRNYDIDDNDGYTYTFRLDSFKFTGVNSNTLTFQYGNDIDHAMAARSDLEVLATAKGSPSNCFTEHPTIVRYEKIKQ